MEDRKGKKMKRTRRQKKSDRVLHGSQSKDAIMCDYALAPVEQVVNEMDRKWGVDRLPELVSVEMAMKFGSAVAKMNKAVEDEDVEQCRVRAEVVVRGFRAMDAEAERLGAQKASQDVWEVEVDGKVYAVMKDARAWQAVKEGRDDVEVITLREVALAYKFFKDSKAGEFEQAVKNEFASAEMITLGGKVFDDSIPF